MIHLTFDLDHLIAFCKPLLFFQCMENFLKTSHHLQTFDASVRPWRDQSIPVVTFDCINNAEKLNRVLMDDI